MPTKLPAIVTTPCIVGLAFRTTFPVPVEVVTPVPPLLTPKVLYTFAKLSEVNPEPFPERLDTEIAAGRRALAIVPVKLPAGMLKTPSTLPRMLDAAKSPAIVTTPCIVGLVFRTTFPVPVLVVTPVPPLPTAKVPYTFAKFRDDTPAPLPVILDAARLPAIVTTPCIVGLVFRTTLPVPVLVVTPVPPLLTPKVLYTFAKFKLESPDPLADMFETAISSGKRSLSMVSTKLPAGMLKRALALPTKLSAVTVSVTSTLPPDTLPYIVVTVADSPSTLPYIVVENISSKVPDAPSMFPRSRSVVNDRPSVILMSASTVTVSDAIST